MKIIFDVDDTIYNLMQPFFEAHNEIYGSRTDADCEQLFMASRIYSDEAFYMQKEERLQQQKNLPIVFVKPMQMWEFRYL